MAIQIHGKTYVTVAERVLEAHAENEKIDILTEFLPVEGMVVCRATVNTKNGVFNGTSAANPTKMIEKQSPYEVAETSAVGRALGFAGYGAVDGIASADEVIKAESSVESTADSLDRYSEGHFPFSCEDCKRGITQKVGEYSFDMYGHHYCFDHQKVHAKLK